ncbi:YggT family protein [Halodesulfovibrio marinisediminis]|uniref:YggT family protein n=1 Tax=Halodesulfovibrio marinisediminis DSM 17456 TaxID=1121457 RepID=A0A1N6DUF0_9BACT|nr:YggT family protein [Halodesulfovibrio marinisediminis]SIN74333.1 YggT family protein [Halodesulfovibrio marinisediminis DSM 17456]
MEIFAMNFVVGIAEILNAVLSIYFWVVIISALLTWVNPDPYNPIVRTLRNLTEPVFYRIRKWLPFTYFNGLDLSPVVLLLAIQFTQIFVIRSMYQLAGAIH